jgi:cytochrome c peroxidase
MTVRRGRGFGLRDLRSGLFLLAALALGGCVEAPQDAAGRPGSPLPPLERLGETLFFDARLSNPAGQSCASCHAASQAFIDPDQDVSSSAGAVAGRFDARNAPTAMYAAFSPHFHYDTAEGLYLGGQFLDGHAATLEAQAKLPFLNPLEMNNRDRQAVVDKVRAGPYAAQFRRVFGPAALDDTEAAYDHIARAIAAFERQSVFNRFSSKYDAYLAGRVALSAAELRGLRAFEAEDKGNCAACHPSKPGRDGTPPLFTDFSYDNLGVARNPHNPYYRQAARFNPDGRAFIDRGLGKTTGRADQDGKFKVPTLRNIELTAPYMHNGFFSDLRATVDFYNTRDTRPRCAGPEAGEKQALAAGCWPEPEVAANVNREELGDLGLSEREVDDIVAFMRTLTDGWTPAGYPARSATAR